MLSIWQLRVGAEAYYLASVASGLDDYYSGNGEAPGVWVAGASSGLGLAGEVAADDLRAVLAGLAPGTGLDPNGGQLRGGPTGRRAWTSPSRPRNRRPRCTPWATRWCGAR